MSNIFFIIEILFIFIFFVLSLILLPIGYIIRKINLDASLSYSKTIIDFVFIVIEKLALVKTNIIYDETLDNKTSKFYISNHRGIFDVVLLYPLIKEKCIIIAKDKFKKYLFLSNWMELIGCYFLDRNNLRSGFKMINYSIDMLNKNISVLIFPEGTRGKTENYVDMLDLKEGCFAIPKKTNVDIVPIAIHDTSLIFEKNKKLCVNKKIFIHFGKLSKYVESDNVSDYYKNKILELM